MNPKEVFDNTAYSVQLPYIAGHSLYLLYSPQFKNLDVYVYSINDILKIYNRVSEECKKVKNRKENVYILKNEMFFLSHKRT